MTTLTALDFDRPADGTSYTTTEMDVTYRKRGYGGWYVTRADNGRQLGWLCRTTGTASGMPLWAARISESAFRGTGPGDEGDVLDTVPPHLSSSNTDGTVDAIGYGRTRQVAAEELLSELLRRHAPAVGYPAHHQVRRWADRYPPARQGET